MMANSFIAWRLAGYGLLLAMLSGSGYLAGKSRADNRWQARWSQRDAADAREAARRQAQISALEARRRSEIEQVTQHAQQQLSALWDDAAAARTGAERLRRELVRLRQSRATAGTSRGGTTADDSVVLLSGLLAESVERNRQLAEEADRRRAAGLACQHAWQAMIDSQP
ncbi:DUF2514 family protein [Erwinia sp. CPCC 100877]|nr:DUF2514 family protein [Erwinia sp. CPCC 100877]